MEVIETILASVLDAAANQALDTLLKALRKDAPTGTNFKEKRPRARFRVEPASFRAALQLQLDFASRWCTTFTYDEMRQTHKVEASFVDLDIHVLPSSRSHVQPTGDSRLPLLAALTNSPLHALIQGQPGAGKTTALQKVVADFIRTRRILLNNHFPIILLLRDIQQSHGIGPLYHALSTLLGIWIEIDPAVDRVHYADYIRRASETAINKFLGELGFAILLDGFDEISNIQLREQVQADLRRLTENVRGSKIIITSRPADFMAALPHSERLDIAEMSQTQIEIFAARQLHNRRPVELFLSQLWQRPYSDMGSRPLLLSYLCAIYDRTGEVPQHPTGVFSRAMYLFIDEWDAKRSNQRHSRYAAFDRDRKIRFLSELAFTLTTIYQTTRINSVALAEIYRRICPDYELPEGEAEDVARELESHNGIIVEFQPREYRFAHKSMQEYLAARHIALLNPLREIVPYMPSLPNELAIAVALSSKPTGMFYDLVLGYFTQLTLPSQFYSTFCSRLELEKADLAPVPIAAVAAAIVLSRLQNPSQFASALQRTFSGRFLTGMREYYSAPRIQGRKINYQLIRPHDVYQLSTAISLSTDVAGVLK